MYGISLIFGHFDLKQITKEAKIQVTTVNLTANILNGPASFKPSFAATKALAHKKIKVIFKMKSIIKINKIYDFFKLC